jgi:hypothetical protein
MSSMYIISPWVHGLTTIGVPVVDRSAVGSLSAGPGTAGPPQRTAVTRRNAPMRKIVISSQNKVSIYDSILDHISYILYTLTH